MSATTKWAPQEILAAALTGIEQGRSREWAPMLSDNEISDVHVDGDGLALVLCLMNGQMFEIRAKEVRP